MGTKKKPKARAKTTGARTVKARLPRKAETWAMGTFEVDDAEGLASAVLVVDLGSQTALFIEVADGAVDGRRVTAAFESACHRPAAGQPRMPARIVVPDEDFFALVEARLGGHLPVVQRECELLADIIAVMLADVSPPPDDGAPGVTREETQMLLEATERLARSARERDVVMLSELDSHQALRVSFPDRDEPGPFVVINISDAEPLLLVLASPQDAAAATAAIARSIHDGKRGDFDRSSRGIDIVFHEARELGDDVRAELGRTIGAILPVDAWIPLVGRFEPPEGGRPPDEGDGAHGARVLAALAQALPELTNALDRGLPERLEGSFELLGVRTAYVVEGPTMDASVFDLFGEEVPAHPFQQDVEDYLRARFLSRSSLPPGLRSVVHIFFAEIADVTQLSEVQPSKLDELVAHAAADAPLTDEELLEWPRAVADYLDDRLGTRLYVDTCEAREERWTEVARDWKVWSEPKVAMLTRRVVDQQLSPEGEFGAALGRAMKRLAGMLNRRRTR